MFLAEQKPARWTGPGLLSTGLSGWRLQFPPIASPFLGCLGAAGEMVELIAEPDLVGLDIDCDGKAALDLPQRQRIADRRGQASASNCKGLELTNRLRPLSGIIGAVTVETR